MLTRNKSALQWLVIIVAGLFLGCTIGYVWTNYIVRTAHAHDSGPGSWIGGQRLTDPQSGEWCCDEKDCQEEPDNIEPVDGGFRIKSTGEFIPTKRVIWKSPGGWWRCRYLAGEQVGKTRCLIGPPQGS